MCIERTTDHQNFNNLYDRTVKISASQALKNGHTILLLKSCHIYTVAANKIRTIIRWRLWWHMHRALYVLAFRFTKEQLSHRRENGASSHCENGGFAHICKFLVLPGEKGSQTLTLVRSSQSLSFFLLTVRKACYSATRVQVLSKWGGHVWVPCLLCSFK